MSDENKALVERFVETVINSGNLDAVGDFLDPDYVELEPLPGQGAGLEGLKLFYTVYLHAFPDVHWTLEEQIAEGDKVVSRYTWRGTHRGPFLDIPASGRKVTVSALVIHRIAGGKLTESRMLVDERGLFQQLGSRP